jgi:tripartite-type tricarboxylate transporter receptor subunit TctC
MRRRIGTCHRRARAVVDALAAALLAVAVAVLPVAARATPPQPFPSRPIHIVVPFAAGNQLDVFARLIGVRLAESMGQPVIVENRPGASGNAASEAVARATPDGHTLLLSGVLITLLPLTHGSRAVDPVAAFAPITRLAQQPIVIAANPSLHANTLPELIALARAAPGKIAYATSGVGTAQHVAMTMLSQRAGIDLLHVPYANFAQLLGDVLAGQVPIAMSFPGTVEPHLKTGRLKVLAVTGPQRALAWPDVPTVAEAGFPGFDVLSWAGVLAPAGTPPEIVDRLHREIVGILAIPEVRSVFLAQSAEPVGNTPEQFAAEIRASVARWAPVIKAAGIRVD